MKAIYSISTLFFFLLLVVAFYQCKKIEKIDRQYYQDSLITGNIAPPYSGVTTLALENYINRLYIDLFGREPLSAEMSSGVDELIMGELSQNTKENYITNLMTSEEYYNRLYDIYSIKMLGGIDTSEIYDNINLFQYIIDSLYIPNGDSLQVHITELELLKLNALYDAKSDYRAGSITINEFVRRFMMNNIYDEINMGTENYVLGSFENLFYRFPTDNEKESAENIVDGQSDILFLQNGSCKLDFSEITTSCNEFYQGMIIDMYQTYVLRHPTTEEILLLLSDFKLNSDISIVQLRLLTSSEYAGF